MAPRLFVIHGPTAAGKLTTAQHLSGLVGGSVFHNHLTVNLCKSLFKHATEEYYDLIEEIRLVAIRHALQKGGKDVVFTIFYWGKDQRDIAFINTLVSLAGECRAGIYFLGLLPELNILRDRVCTQERKQLGKPSTPEEFENATSGWEYVPINHPNSYVINNSLKSPQETCELFLSMIAENLLS
jgi:hypothetical protein